MTNKTKTAAAGDADAARAELEKICAEIEAREKVAKEDLGRVSLELERVSAEHARVCAELERTNASYSADVGHLKTLNSNLQAQLHAAIERKQPLDDIGRQRADESRIADTKPYTVKCPIHHDGEPYGAGRVIHLGEKDAASLLAVDAISNDSAADDEETE